MPILKVRKVRLGNPTKFTWSWLIHTGSLTHQENKEKLTSVILQRALMAGPRYTSSFPVMSLVRLRKIKLGII